IPSRTSRNSSTRSRSCKNARRSWPAVSFLLGRDLGVFAFLYQLEVVLPMSMLFTLGEPVEIEESLTCEFKELKGESAIHAIGKNVEQYVVGYLTEVGGSI